MIPKELPVKGQMVEDVVASLRCTEDSNNGVTTEDSVHIRAEPIVVVSKNDSSDKRPPEPPIDVWVLALINWWLNPSGNWYQGKHQRC